MSKGKTAPFGSWNSPISADLITAGTVRVGQIVLDGNDIYWVEMRPSERGRNIIIKRSLDGEKADMTSPEFNVRTRAHEYGGGAFIIKNETIYFVNDKDQRIYRQKPYKKPEAITPDKPYCFADLMVDETRGQLIAVLEDHSDPTKEAVSAIAAISLIEGNEIKTLASGNDFYSSLCLSPDNKKLAWLCWNHPNMPWDGTKLFVADHDNDGSLRNLQKVAGGPDESIFQPQWSPDGILYFVSDKSNWWNICRWQDDEVQPVCERSAEFGVPQWIFGMSTFAFESSDKIICTFFEKSQWHIGALNVDSGSLDIIETPFTEIQQLRSDTNKTVFIGGTPIITPAIVCLDSKTQEFEIIHESSQVKVKTTYFSRPEIIEYQTGNNLPAHAYFYAPQNLDYDLPNDQLPPLIVRSHGGPTGSATTSLDLKIQFWTSRGFALLDVNYGGSTGYGREYRQRLNAQWGIMDVEDCINAAKYAVAKGWVDKNLVAIAGGSAGGFTTLCALTFHDFFKAGASYYGVSDLEALVKETHKFESHYLNKLIGAYPERRDLYLKRSPIHFTDQLSCPVILLQGLEDKVVPPNQAEMMVNALRKKGLPVAYITFEGEQHGFRQAKNIKKALEAELYFYSKIFGFELADDIEPIHIENRS